MKPVAFLSVLAAAGALCAATVARADEPPPAWEPGSHTTSAVGPERSERAPITGDGTYGRFDGDYDVGIRGGVEFGEDSPLGAAGVSAHYFWLAGVYAAFAGSSRDDHPVRDRLSFGLDVKPAFLVRWSQGWQQGPSTLDLTVDSISLALGAYFEEPNRGDFADRRGFESSVGFGVPLGGTAEGLWLGARGILRWDDPKYRGSHAARAAALLSLEWHWML